MNRLKFYFLSLLLVSTTSLFPQTFNCEHIDNPSEWLKGTWQGYLSQYSCGLDATFQMIMEIKKIKKNQLKGFFIWKELEVTSDTITIKLWDKSKIDGDIIILRLNNETILNSHPLGRDTYSITITLQSGENILEMYAENLGMIPPNTAAFSIWSSGERIKVFTLESDMISSGAIRIVKLK